MIQLRCVLLGGLMLALSLTACGDSGSSDGASDATGTGESGTDGGGEAGTNSGGGDGDGDGDAMCASGTYWTQGNLESELMHPGGACLACHDAQIGEDIVGQFQIAGTVYSMLHDVDDCNGVDSSAGPVTVEITDANATVVALPVNSAGNFFYDLQENPPLTFPINAKVKRGGMEMAMVSAQSMGDCNSCHTEQGANGAPGRIIAP